YFHDVSVQLDEGLPLILESLAHLPTTDARLGVLRLDARSLPVHDHARGVVVKLLMLALPLFRREVRAAILHVRGYVVAVTVFSHDCVLSCVLVGWIGLLRASTILAFGCGLDLTATARRDVARWCYFAVVVAVTSLALMAAQHVLHTRSLPLLTSPPFL